MRRSFSSSLVLVFALLVVGVGAPAVGAGSPDGAETAWVWAGDVVAVGPNALAALVHDASAGGQLLPAGTVAAGEARTYDYRPDVARPPPAASAFRDSSTILSDTAGDCGRVRRSSSGSEVLTYAPSGLADDVLRLSPAESWGNSRTLARHFRDHGADFAARSADDYARQASEFLQRAQRSGLPTKIDADGVIRVYDPATNTFGAFNANGTTRTFFKPTSPTYWDRQPGSSPWTP